MSTSRHRLVSIVVPVYNESENIAGFHAKLCRVIDAIPRFKFEIVCVDDGSSDETLQRLIELMGRDRRLRVVELSRNFGKEAALSAGLDAARGDAAIPIDADLQDPPDLIPALLTRWEQGAEMVLARRMDRGSDSLLKRSSASLFYRVHNLLSPIKIPQNVGDFRLMDRVVLDALRLLPERQRFMKGLFAWVGFKTATVDYNRTARHCGRTKFSGPKLWTLAVEGLTSFSTAPLKVCAYVGLITALATIVYAGFILVRTLVQGVDVPGYASLLVAVLFLGSVQLIGLGLLGEYVGRIYMESKQRPRYIIRREYQTPFE